MLTQYIRECIKKIPPRMVLRLVLRSDLSRKKREYLLKTIANVVRESHAESEKHKDEIIIRRVPNPGVC